MAPMGQPKETRLLRRVFLLFLSVDYSVSIESSPRLSKYWIISFLKRQFLSVNVYKPVTSFLRSNSGLN
mgnify:CR=1 FL=1